MPDENPDPDPEPEPEPEPEDGLAVEVEVELDFCTPGLILTGLPNNSFPSSSAMARVASS